MFMGEPISSQVIAASIIILCAAALGLAIDWLMNVELGMGWTLLLLLLTAAGIVLRLALGLLVAIVSIFKTE